MKRIWKLLSLLMVFALLAGIVAMVLTGCGKTEEPAEDGEFPLEVEGFQVGFSRVDMNPEVNAPLDGMGAMDKRYIQKMTDGGMTCTAVALSDGHGTHYMWMTSDLMASDPTINDVIRKGISQKTGFPEENFIIAVSHSHSSPSPSASYLSGSSEYRQIVVRQHIEAGINALKDRKPARLYVGSVETDRLIFIRHYMHTTMDGEVKYFGDNFGVAVYDETTDHVAEADGTMNLLRFAREGEKDVIVANYQAHPHFTDGVTKYELSADYIVSFRDALEHYSGAHVAFFQGAAGDVNSKSRLEYEQRTTDMRTWGTFLAQHAMDGLENNMREVEDPRIEFKHMILEAEINRSMDHLYVQAKEVSRIFSETGDRASVNHLLKQDGTGIRSVYHASAVIANMSRTTAKDGMLPLKAMSFGEDVVLLTYCGELFQEHRLAMEEYSKFDTTMIFGYADYRAAYLPSKAAFEYTCYETDMFRFTPDTPDRVREVYMTLLDDVYSRYE